MRRRLLAAGVATVVTAALLAAAPSSQAAPPTWCSDKSDLAIIGTSADTGFDTTGYNGAAASDGFYPTTYGWTTKLRDSVKAQWGTTASNYAHNGSMASDYLPGGRWPMTVGATGAMQSTQPSIVFVDLGGNEYYSQVNPAVFKANLAQVIANTRSARADALILLSIYPELDRSAGVSQYGATQYSWGQYATAIYDTAVSQGTGLVDLRQDIPPATASQQPQPSTWANVSPGDRGIHQNDAGNLVEYAKVWNWVAALWSVCAQMNGS